MTTLLRYSMRAYLTLRYFFHWLTRTGCYGKHQAQEFTPNSNHTSGASLKAGLFRHHVKQFHESSCSVASVVSAINTLRERFNGPEKPITQRDILDKVRAAHWKERMGPDGYNGRRGLPLDVLGKVVKASLDAYHIPYDKVDVIRASGGNQAAQTKKQVLKDLKAFESQDNCLLIAHFDQGGFVKEMNIPHISPVGGFDPDTGLVTMLDVDPGHPKPYRIPFHVFYKGISTRYGGVFRPFGYDRGGVIVIRLA